MYGTWVRANNLCHMTLVAKPERDSANTDKSSLNVCNINNNIFYRGTRWNDLQFKKSWGHVQVSKRLKEYLSKCSCRLFSTRVQWFVYSTSLGSLARHTTLCALEVIFNTSEIALLQKYLLNLWDGEAPVEWNSIICFP